MTNVALSGGSYLSRALVAAAQRCVNLYPEQTPAEQGEDPDVVDLPTPGTLLLGTAPTPGCRCLYRASNGKLYGVYGATVYTISAAWAFTAVGTINVGPTICSMADNGTTILLVDGSVNGWSIDMPSSTLAPIVSTGFLGGTSVWYIDTFFVLNAPGTFIYYCSDSEAITFNPLNFASKTGYADPVANLTVVDRQIWLIGVSTTEIHNDVGGAAFPFQAVQGAFIEHGTGAPYSVARTDSAVFFLSQDLSGSTVVLQGSGYTVERISNHGVEEAIRGYAVISDAEGYCYQQGGHEFYMLTFPSESKTWCYDRATKLWHERVYLDGSGNEMRHQSRVCATFNGRVVVGDYSSGNLYALDLDTYSDNGQSIKRLRTFPHMVKDQRRVSYMRFVANMQGGGAAAADPGLISLRWSDTRGASWGNPVINNFGAQGQDYASAQWRRLGMARDRVFELSWSSAAQTGLLGASIDMMPAGS